MEPHVLKTVQSCNAAEAMPALTVYQEIVVVFKLLISFSEHKIHVF